MGWRIGAPDHLVKADMQVFFFGIGYSSRAAARAIRKINDGDTPISGSTRNGENAKVLNLEHIDAHVFDGSKPGSTLGTPLSRASHVINSIAPDQNGDAVLNHHRADLEKSKSLDWLCYYSTVGVYGNADGAWIDETALCHPLNQRAKWRIDAENAWRAFANERRVPLLILRLAGIYGPGRSSFDKLKAGTARAIIKPGQVFNRIHVADIARVTALAAMAKLEGTYNLADDEPAPAPDLVGYAAKMMDVAPPPDIPFESADMTPMARSFYADNKRVSNAAIKKALGIELLYPTYREGLTAIYGAS